MYSYNVKQTLKCFSNLILFTEFSVNDVICCCYETENVGCVEENKIKYFSKKMKNKYFIN